METENSGKKDVTVASLNKLDGDAPAVKNKDQMEPMEDIKSSDIFRDSLKKDKDSARNELVDEMDQIGNLLSKNAAAKLENHVAEDDSNKDFDESRFLESKGHRSGNDQIDINQSTEEILAEEKDPEPVFDGTEYYRMEAGRSLFTHSVDSDSDSQKVVQKVVSLKNLVKVKSVIAVTNFLRRLTGQSDEDAKDVAASAVSDDSDSTKDNEGEEVSQKATERSWNPLSYIRMSLDVDSKNKIGEREDGIDEPPQYVIMKGRIMLYTRLGCPDCKEARLYFQRKRLRYVEINVDLYPSRKLELEKICGSSAVPKVLFNEVLIGGLSELRYLEESGKLDEKIDYLISEVPSFEAPLPPLSGEDDMSSTGAIDELALVVRKMKEYVVIKDRFYKMRRFTNAFLGLEAVDFLSDDQYLERKEAIQFGRKLASKLFFQHVLEENLFEDGNHLYRFLDDDPLVSQCHNISRGITDVKPKPIAEISSRLRLLLHAIFEAYTSEDGKRICYRSIHGSEEFARYLRIVEELQRVEIHDISREEKLAFFINLYNMMVIHAILMCHPSGVLERIRLSGDFKYVIGGSAYSISAIQNGILRGNQRPPYNLLRPFGQKDKRTRVALPYPEPLIHFALVWGTRSGPALRRYTPGNIDRELMEAARNFIRHGGVIVDFDAEVVSVSKIFKWFSVDFGKNEIEVLKHASNYLDQSVAEALLKMLANSQLKVIYQPFDWGLNR